MRITVLGAGLVGSAIIKDLATDFDVDAVDYSMNALASVSGIQRVNTKQADLSQAANVTGAVADADLVICAVPGSMGFNTLKAILEAGKNVVDISFFGEDAFELDALAKEKGLVAVVDCGVAPGLCNLQAGYVSTMLDSVESYLCYVGGLPVVRTWPYEYKAVFSPSDVIEEYTRPARFVEYGQLVTKPALSDVELLELPGAGTLEAFNTDGLRSLAKTLDAPFMKEKTLRYPGHANLMRVFRESGFFSAEPIEVKGQHLVPLQLTSRLLFDDWKMQAGDEDFTVMQVILTGKKQGHFARYTFDLFDRFDRESHTHSMARTTGYTCTVAARLVAEGAYTQPGISPPEYLGRQPGLYQKMVAGLAQRGVLVHETVSAE
jgi:saccharopine dehydrogenase-like NADP-dependent oxidoreductase